MILMMPTIGRIVLFTVTDSLRANNNGQVMCAAVITAVHSPTMVNLTLFLDGPAHEHCSFVPQGEGTPYTWRWPSRD